MYMQKSYPPETSHILFSEPLCHVFHHFLVRKGRVDACILARWTHSVFCALGISYAGSPPSAIAGSNHLCFPQIIRHSTNGHCTVFHHILTRQGCVNTCVLSRWTHNIFRAQGIAYETLCCWLLGSIGCSLPSRCSEQIWYSADCNCTVFDCILPRQNRVDTYALTRWTHSVFRASGVSHAGSPPSAIAGLNGLHPSLVSGIQPMVTVQCFTAF